MTTAVMTSLLVKKIAIESNGKSVEITAITLAHIAGGTANSSHTGNHDDDYGDNHDDDHGNNHSDDDGNDHNQETQPTLLQDDFV